MSAFLRSSALTVIFMLSSSLIVMSIVGGAIAPPFMGHIADVHSMRIGMVVPLVCFVFIAIYGATWQRQTKDAANNRVPL